MSDSVTVTGKVTRVEVKFRAPYEPFPRYRRGWGARPTVLSHVYLDIAMELPDGRTAYFKTPGRSKFYSNEWTHLDNERGHEAKVSVGDELTVSGKVKCERVSRKGNAYVVLNYVKKVEEDAAVAA